MGYTEYNHQVKIVCKINKNFEILFFGGVSITYFNVLIGAYCVLFVGLGTFVLGWFWYSCGISCFSFPVFPDAFLTLPQSAPRCLSGCVSLPATPTCSQSVNRSGVSNTSPS